MASGTVGPPLHTRLLRKLKGDVSTDWLSRSIFKVPIHLRRISEQAYEPQVISIGPYHHGKELFNLTVMPNDEAKDFMGIAIEFFSRVMPGSLRRPENQDIKHLLGLVHDSSQAPSPDFPEVRISCLPEKVIRSLCPEARLKAMAIPCLSSPSKSAEEDEECESAENRKEQITQMPPPSMAAPLVCSSPTKSSEEVNSPNSDSDNLPFRAAAAPLINFLQPKSPEEPRFLPPKAMTIPSSSLSKTLEEIVSTAAPSVGVSASNSLKGVLSSPFDSSDPSYLEEMDKPVGISALPLVSFPPSESSHSFYLEEMDEPAELGQLPLVRSPPPKPELDSKPASDPNRKEWRFIRSATELSEAGINFKKIKGRLFDIKFQEGVMLIPTLSINDDTESILRNLVAYEQCFKGTSSKCFTDYITFMDCLINTGKDVELLCLRGVIDNWLGDHEVVAAIFNKLRDCVLISEEDFSYAETFRKVNEHCDRKWNQWKANLWHNYFNTPWAAISFFAAVFLLLFTALQTVYAVLSYQFK
ncbi:hypothetical protein SLEP1_g41195 [Rubroshorea leprosula]|uniref:Uncharacterized protein n=1 Tax=Rubroshorea leprosula TaxID=152421 RepID=A0AAV5L5X0_9ROSI|nr:hypothetical protein SLEP1_g41195 [Rubroshorea leprosula]